MATASGFDEQPVLNIVGGSIALGPQRRDLAPLYQRWLNDVTVMAPLGMPLRPVTLEWELNLFAESEAAHDQVWFTLYERAPPRPLGITGLRDIDHQHGTAEFVIFIGETDCWGKGYGAETARLLLDYGFSALGLRNIMLKVYSTNLRGIRAYTKAGFREIDRRRQAHRLGRGVADVILMDCLAEEFKDPALRRMLAAGEDDRTGEEPADRPDA